MQCTRTITLGLFIGLYYDFYVYKHTHGKRNTSKQIALLEFVLIRGASGNYNALRLGSIEVLPLKISVLCSGQNWNVQKLQRAITPKLGNQELRFLYTALLLIQIYPPMKFHIDTSYIFCVMLRTKLKCAKITKGNNFKDMMCRVMVLVHCTSP